MQALQARLGWHCAPTAAGALQSYFYYVRSHSRPYVAPVADNFLAILANSFTLACAARAGLRLAPALVGPLSHALRPAETCWPWLR